MRTVISPTVAVATPTRGKSLAVCTHAHERALAIVTALAGGEEEEELEEVGLQEFMSCLACLRFMPHSLAPFYKWGERTGPFDYQANKLGHNSHENCRSLL